LKPLPALAGQALVKAAFWIPLALCLALALAPNPSALSASMSGSAAHAAAFTYLSAALFPAHFKNGPALAVALWLFAFGVLIEVAQLFVAGRSGDFADLLSDAAGITAGCVVHRVWRQFQPAS